MNNTFNETTIGSKDMPVFRLIPLQQLNRTLCSVFGIPLNLLVVAVILRSRQLWSTRNIFWLAVTFFNLLALTQSVTELVLFYLYRRGDGSYQTLCEIYSLLRGYPYTLLLTGLVLASWDRYLALTRHDFYQHYATPRIISLILVLVFIIVTGGQTLPYLLGILPITCGVNLVLIPITLSFQSVMSTLGLVVQLKLYIFVRNCIHYASSSEDRNNIELVSYPVSNISVVHERSPNLPLSQNSDDRINKLELRAARILGLGILPFSLVTFILCISSVGLVVCRISGQEGFFFFIVMVILREFLLIHLVYIPAVFIVQSREFRVAVQRFCRNRRPKPTANLFS